MHTELIIVPSAPEITVPAQLVLLGIAAIGALLSWPGRREQLRARTWAGVTIMLLGALGALCLATLPAPAGSMPRQLLVTALTMAISAVGGNAIVRIALRFAEPGAGAGTYDRILVRPGHDDGESVEVLRGGTAIGVLERLMTTGCIALGAVHALAVLAAIKGVGRFGELSAPDARERFIIGSLASLAWAGLMGVTARMAGGWQ